MNGTIDLDKVAGSRCSGNMVPTAPTALLAMTCSDMTQHTGDLIGDGTAKTAAGSHVSSLRNAARTLPVMS